MDLLLNKFWLQLKNYNSVNNGEGLLLFLINQAQLLGLGLAIPISTLFQAFSM
jgi:hypothetical protein